jgi:hypothetical protein
MDSTGWQVNLAIEIPGRDVLARGAYKSGGYNHSRGRVQGGSNHPKIDAFCQKGPPGFSVPASRP